MVGNKRIIPKINNNRVNFIYFLKKKKITYIYIYIYEKKKKIKGLIINDGMDFVP
jgi:hypothetical protein